ncbi:hypothetical protein Tco_0126442 [Tanacetum coccineum]
MSIAKEQQQALDDDLVPREQRLWIGNLNKQEFTQFRDPGNFQSMLPKFVHQNLPGQKFVDPPFEEEILDFIRELGYPGDIKSLSDVKVDTLYQP